MGACNSALLAWSTRVCACVRAHARAFVIGISDGLISVFFSPTLAKILATLLVAFVLVVRPGGLFGDEEG